MLLACCEQDDSLQTIASSGDEQQACMLGRAPSPRSPSSPWMPFSMLFAAISAKVPRSDMDLVHKYYEEFKVICPSFGDFQPHAIFVCWHANYGMVFDVKIEEKDKQA